MSDRNRRTSVPRWAYACLGIGMGLLCLLFVLFGKAGQQGKNSPDVIDLFAASSLSDLLTEIARDFESEHGIKVRLNFASSSTLARQIEAGAEQADIFISAHVDWMDRLEELGLVQTATRRNFASNRLVLIGEKEGDYSIEMTPRFDLAGASGGRVAIGDPDHVPAGIYGREALEHLGWWDSLRPQLIRTLSAREALRLVESGEVKLGIVYASDAKSSDRVKTVGVFPKFSHEPIQYPIALCMGADKNSLVLLETLFAPQTRARLRQMGFEVDTP